MKILVVRGAFLNRYEGQNFEPLAKRHEIVGIGSKTAIHKNFAFPVKTFFSPYDLTRSKFGKAIFNRVLGDSHYLIGLENYVRKTGPWDVAHIAETYYGYDLQIALLKIEGVIKKIVSTCWETIPHNNESLEKKRKIKEVVKRHIDLYICPTERAKTALVKEGVREEKIKVVRIGVNLKKFRVKNLELRVKEKDHITILFVGRGVPEKGLDDLKEAGLVNLRIVESTQYEEMPEIYRQADILVVPSKTTETWEEQYGIVLVEGMASGLPIVAYKSGAISEVMGEAGILVDEGDIVGLKRAIEQLISDQNLRKKLGKMGRARAEKYFNAEIILREIEKNYFS